MEEFSVKLILAAFGAGLISFVSPCVLPLVPAYVGYMGGQTTRAAVGEAEKKRFAVLIHGVFFVLGLSVVFVALGITAGAISGFLQSDFVRYVGGILIVLFGLHIMGAFRWVYFRLSPAWQKRLQPIYSALYADTRRQMQGKKELGYLGSGLMGMLFAGGWSPCLGPIVGSVLLTVASGDSTPLEGGVTLFAYTMGLGVPFLIVAGALDRATGFLRRLQRHMAKIELASGALLILIGVLLMGGVLQDLVTLGGTRAREGLTVDAVDKDLLAELIDNTLAGDVQVGLGEGEAAPNFRTQNIRGELVTLEDSQGKVVLLNFWATWCEPCRNEMPEFEQAEREYGDWLVVLPVNLEETPEQIVTFAEDEDIDLDFLIDQKGTIHERYNVTGYPTTYVIRPDGTVLFKHPGPITLEQIGGYLEQIEANEAG